MSVPSRMESGGLHLCMCVCLFVCLSVFVCFFV